MYKVKKERLENSEVNEKILKELKYLEFLGEYNDYPRPITYIKPVEYFEAVNSYMIRYTDSRQIFNKGDCIKGLNLQFFDENGYGVETDYVENKIKFFKIGCKHDYEEKKIRNQYYGYKCKKCGYYEERDTSG